MKQINIKVFILTALIFSLSSCLKESNMNIDSTKGPKNVVEFGNTGNNISGSSSTYPRFNTDLGSVAAGASASFNVNVSYSGVDVAPSDITVTIAPDASALETYNTENGTSLEIPPASVVSFPTTAVIKKGTRLAQIPVTVTVSNDFNFDADYAVPLSITAASLGTVSSNFGKALYSFSARNSYDGVYDVTGTFVDLTNANFVGYYPKSIGLVTNGSSGVSYYDYDLGNFGYLFDTDGTGSLSYFGNWAPVFKFDANGNVTSVSNYYSDPAPRSRNSQLDTTTPGVVNKYDATTKTLDVNYFMIQSGNIRLKIHEIYKYKEPR